MSAPQNGADILARIRPELREESTKLCLRPDLLKAWQEAEEELAEARTGETGTRLADGGVTRKVRDLAKKVQRLESEIADNFITFTFRAMPKDEYRALCDQHPPRKEDQVDGYLGFNRQAVTDALVRASLIDPVFDDCTEAGCGHQECGSWQAFLRVCNEVEWNELREVSQTANSAVTGAPKSQLASQILARRATTSK